MSPHARVQHYRDKLKEDPEAWVNYKKKEAERKREARKKMTDDQRRRASEMAKLRRKRRLLNLALAGLGAQTPSHTSGLTKSGDMLPLTQEHEGYADDISRMKLYESLGLSPGVQSPGSETGLAPQKTRSADPSPASQADLLQQMLPQGIVDQPVVESILKERQREFWREEKRKYRARMSEQKRQEVRQHDADYKRSRRQLLKESAEYWNTAMEEDNSEELFIKQEPVWTDEEEDQGYSYPSYNYSLHGQGGQQDPRDERFAVESTTTRVRGQGPDYDEQGDDGDQE